VSLWQHPGGGLLCDQKCPERGDLQCALDLGRNELDEGSAGACAGVVDDYVRCAVLTVDVSEQPLHLRLVLSVADEGAGARFGAQRRKLCGIARGDCDGEILLPEQPGKRRTQPLTGADDQRGRVGRRCHNSLLYPARLALQRRDPHAMLHCQPPLHDRPRPGAGSSDRQWGCSMPIELHAFDTPNGRKISVALEEMALPYTVTIVDIRKGHQFDPEFLKISPNGKIPAIVDPDGPNGKPVSVFESGAILIYLGEKTGKFWPRDLEARIPVLEWLMFQQGGFGPIPGQVHHFLTIENEENRRYGLERFSKETRRLYGVMDRRLAAREFFADEPSIADFSILGWAWRHPRHKVDLAEFPHVRRWYEAMMARPGVQRGFAVKLS